MPYLGVWAPREVSKAETIPKVPELGQGVRTPNWQQSQTQKVTGIRIRCQYPKQKSMQEIGLFMERTHFF